MKSGRHWSLFMLTTGLQVFIRANQSQRNFKKMIGLKILIRSYMLCCSNTFTVVMKIHSLHRAVVKFGGRPQYTLQYIVTWRTIRNSFSVLKQGEFTVSLFQQFIVSVSSAIRSD